MGKCLRCLACVVAVVATAAFILAGCGNEATGSSVEPVTSSTEQVSGLELAPPDGRVLAVFQALAKELEGTTIYAPTLLPAGARVESGPFVRADSASEPDETLARAEVRVEVPEHGLLRFLVGIAGDVGDLPHESIQAEDGRQIAVYEVLGGVLAQWNAQGLWHGIYGKGVSKEVVIAVALGMAEVD